MRTRQGIERRYLLRTHTTHNEVQKEQNDDESS